MENQENSLSSTSESRDINYYSVLQCNQNSTIDEIKSNYRSLIKKFHPDKQSKEQSYSDDKFIHIDKAYKTLSDEQLRKEYDAVLLEKSFNESSLIYAELEKTGLDFDSQGVAVFPCRCGQNIEIYKSVLDDEESLIECSECTNCVLIK